MKIEKGTKIYIDAFLCGIVKAVVQKVDGRDALLKITSKNNKYFKRNEIVEKRIVDLIPRNCLHIRNGQYRVKPFVWEYIKLRTNVMPIQEHLSCTKIIAKCS